MSKFTRILHLALIPLLISACTGSAKGLWGELPTPSPEPSATPIPSVTASLTPTPLYTPVKILPMPGTPTPIGPSPTPGTPTATLPAINSTGPMDVYKSQSGDTLNILAKRFNVSRDEFISNVVLPAPEKLLAPGTILIMPRQEEAGPTSPSLQTIPDSEIINGPSSIGFDASTYVSSKGGYLSEYKEYILSGGWTTGEQAVMRIARENSLNPRIILAIIEYESHWVLGQPTNLAQDEYPLGYTDYHYRGLFRQLMWASGMLSEAYYGWRSGNLKEITFEDGSTLRLNPTLNAGTVAIQVYFAQTHTRAEWEQAISSKGFAALYESMFGPTWPQAAPFEPVLTADLQQPSLTLPFEVGHTWALMSGPHSAWEKKGALAALDFAPSAQSPGCVENDAWVVAPAPGKVVRVEKGVVVLDLDGDGYEQTGWTLLFLHIRTDGKAKLGDYLNINDHIGHASCEGGVSTGTHLHFARKYNGEWMLADGAVPLNLDGWIAKNGEIPYKGSLNREGVTITACTCATQETYIIREEHGPK